ncbi:MAG: acetate--CoA ligase family protein [Patescibacteria group bacterium]
MFDYIFKPKSIALIGASRDPNSLGHDILENVKKLGFTGKIYPVNLKAKKILGLTCYKSVLDIKDSVDLAIIMVPAQFVSQVIKECGRKKVPGAVIISAGFKETGDAGLVREKELQYLARKNNIKIIGPNCLGILNPHIKLNASFAEGMPKAGNVGLVSQSGAMAVAILDWAYQSGLGFSKIISIGNKAGLSEIELFKYLSSDLETKIIMMYLESITDGREFMKLADKVSNKKPIIVLKAGSSNAGSKAISSHTGSLAGSDQAIETAFWQSGVIRARSVEDLFDFAKAFSQLPLPRGNKVAIVTNAGGPGIMATDAVCNTNLELANLSPETKKILTVKLPKSASVNNPIDIIGDALTDRYEIALTQVLKDKNVDSVVLILTPQTMTQENETAELVVRLAKKNSKPILPVFMGGEDVNSGRQILMKNNLPNFDFCERAIRALDKMLLAKRIKTDVVLAKYKTTPKKINFSKNKIQLKTIDAEKLISSYGLPVLESKLIKGESEINKIHCWPVAIKIASRDIIHKKASGAIRININTPDQAETAMLEVINNVKAINKHNEIDGILVQPMARSGAVEIIIGMKRDENFGPMIMFGLGGSFVEVLKDVSFSIAPITKKQAREQIEKVKSFSILKKYDTNLLADILVKVSHLAMDYPEIRELDLNPVMLYRKGASIIDVRIML